MCFRLWSSRAPSAIAASLAASAARGQSGFGAQCAPGFLNHQWDLSGVVGLKNRVLHCVEGEKARFSSINAEIIAGTKQIRIDEVRVQLLQKTHKRRK